MTEMEPSPRMPTSEESRLQPRIECSPPAEEAVPCQACYFFPRYLTIVFTRAPATHE
jgi:hypothetical protein